jgi:hypothetical protein
MMPGNNISLTVMFWQIHLYTATAVVLVESPAEIPLLSTGAEKA